MSDARKHPSKPMANVNHQCKNVMGWRVLTGGFFDLEKFWNEGTGPSGRSIFSLKFET